MLKLLLVFISIKVLAHKSNPMRLKVFFTNMYVPIVGLKIVRPFFIHRGHVAPGKKRVKRGTPQVGRVHRTRCFVNTNHKHTATLLDLSPNQVRVSFDRAMLMVGRRDHRSYAQVVLHSCGSNFSKSPSVTNNEALHNNEVVCDIINSDSTSPKADRAVPGPLTNT